MSIELTPEERGEANQIAESIFKNAALPNVAGPTRAAAFDELEYYQDRAYWGTPEGGDLFAELVCHIVDTMWDEYDAKCDQDALEEVFSEF
jgi:hypothetical protein